jgi:predicted amidophosphoribosyltransferase
MDRIAYDRAFVRITLSYLALVIPVNVQSTFLSPYNLMCRNCGERTPDMPRLCNERLEPLCQSALYPFWFYNITS